MSAPAAMARRTLALCWQRRADFRFEPAGIGRTIELRAHEKPRGAALHKFLIARHVQAVLQPHARNGMDQAAPVIAFNKQDLRAE